MLTVIMITFVYVLFGIKIDDLKTFPMTERIQKQDFDANCGRFKIHKSPDKNIYLLRVFRYWTVSKNDKIFAFASFISFGLNPAPTQEYLRVKYFDGIAFAHIIIAHSRRRKTVFHC